MNIGISSFIIFLSIFWFLVYWVLGGVFFAIMAILRLGRIRKVRFSCLFTLLSALSGIGASYFGVGSAKEAIENCTAIATGRAQIIVSVIGCGFSGIMMMFLIGIIVLVLGGFLIMSISKTKTKPWIVFDQEEDGEIEQVAEVGEAEESQITRSKFF